MSDDRIQQLGPLTGIRVLAAIFVFNAHVAPPAAGGPIVASVSVAGHDWMTMFFVLSGLVLTWNYEGSLGEHLAKAPARTYYVARFARIYPLYLFALALVIVSLVTRPIDLSGLLTNPALILHVLTLQSWSPDLAVAYGFNGPAWSVGVEVFLYSLFPLLLLPFRSIRNRTGALVLVGAIAVLLVVALTVVLILSGNAALPRVDAASAHRWLYRTPLTRLPDFVLGIALGHLAIALRATKMDVTGRTMQTVGAVAVVALMLIPAVSGSVWSLDSTNMVPFALLLLGLVLAPHTVLARILGSRSLVFLGECTYAFYLLHQVVISAVGRANDGASAWLSTWVVAFTLTLFASVGAHMLIERPVRQWLRRHLDPRPVPPRPSPAITE